MAGELTYEFDAQLWEWAARRELWTFVRLPADASEEIREIAGDIPRGFGAVEVAVRIGLSQWRTSIFPESKGGAYTLPVKASVRRAQQLEVGDTAHVWLEVLP